MVSENALVQAHPTLNKFKLDMVFMGVGPSSFPRQEILTRPRMPGYPEQHV